MHNVDALPLLDDGMQIPDHSYSTLNRRKMHKRVCPFPPAADCPLRYLRYTVFLTSAASASGEGRQ